MTLREMLTLGGSWWSEGPPSVIVWLCPLDVSTYGERGRAVRPPPDEVLILTWNLVPEVRSALAPLVAGGTRLLVALPGLADVTVDGRDAGAAEAGTSVR